MVWLIFRLRIQHRFFRFTRLCVNIRIKKLTNIICIHTSVMDLPDLIDDISKLSIKTKKNLKNIVLQMNVINVLVLIFLIKKKAEYCKEHSTAEELVNMHKYDDTSKHFN